MTVKLLLLILLSSALSCKASGPLHWDYSTKGDAGPAHWGKLKGMHCSGAKQSPLNLEKSQAVTYAPLQLEHYDLAPAQAHLVNNGHTLKLSTDAGSPEKVPTIKGGGLPAQYKFAQVHFHWGSKEEQGSEHQVEGKAYPMEMHLVHYKASFANLSAAVEKEASDNLAVLGVLFKVSDSPNPGLSKLVPRLPEVKQSKAKILDAPTVALASLLDTLDTASFYRYEGSLTTPGCNEIVQWTVFKNPISVTTDQLEALRALDDGHGKPLGDNFRPVQAVGQRKIYFTSTKTSGGARIMVGPGLLLILAFLCSF